MQFEVESQEKSGELSTVKEKLSALEARNRELTSQHSSLDQSLQAELEMAREEGVHYSFLPAAKHVGQASLSLLHL